MPVAGDSRTPRGGFNTQSAILTSAPGRPVVTYNKGRALLTIVTHSGYNGNEKRYTVPVGRNCYGYGDDTLTFAKACSQYVVHNTTAAEPLFKQSCDEGDPAGCSMLASYFTGEKTWLQALTLYKSACADGEPDACEEMAEAYRIGHGVPKDAAQTRTYYDRACSTGNSYSCDWMQGKIDPDCPHGFRSYRVDFNKNTYKVACVVPGEGFARTEYELTPSPAELADMKSYGAYMRDHKATPVGAVVRELLKNPQGTHDPNCLSNDVRGSDGNPIAGSGCAGSH
jgi:hypothetical protein